MRDENAQQKHYTNAVSHSTAKTSGGAGRGSKPSEHRNLRRLGKLFTNLLASGEVGARELSSICQLDIAVVLALVEYTALSQAADTTGIPIGDLLRLAAPVNGRGKRKTIAANVLAVAAGELREEES